MAEHDVIRANCDAAIFAMARVLIQDAGATGEMVLDRMLTFAAAQAVGWSGPAEAAAAFREIADKIEGGAFAAIEAQKAVQRH